MEKTDRRIRRTKTLLLQGLIRLMETKSINDISVKELCETADINRGTFYLHYTDVYQMLGKIEDEMLVEFNDILDRTLPPDPEKHSPEPILLGIFTFLERHRDIARVMMGPHGDLAFVNRLKGLVQERLARVLGHQAAGGLYMESFAVSGCIGVIETWLHHPNPGTPQEMALICGGMLTRGLTL